MKSFTSAELYFYSISSMLLLMGLYFVMNALYFYDPIDRLKFFLFSLLLSLPLWVGYVFAARFFLKNRPASELTSCLGVSFIFFILFGYFFLRFINARSDVSELNIQNPLIINKYEEIDHISAVRPNMFGQSIRKKYYVVVESWGNRKSPKVFSAEKDTYDSITVGHTRAHLEIKPGFLGFEWLPQPYRWIPVD